MIQEKLKELMKPILKEVYAEGYNAGQEDTSRRMYQLHLMGYERGYAEALAEHGVVELDDIEGINECLSCLVEEKIQEVCK